MQHRNDPDPEPEPGPEPGTEPGTGPGTGPGTAGGPAPGPSDPVLAAARSAILDLGLRRTTLAEVARRAGVSRMTLYRQYGDLDTIVSALLTSELTTELTGVLAAVAGLPTARARIAEATALTVAAVAGHPLLHRVLDVDPELLLPLVVDRVGSTQREGLRLLTELLRAGQADGSVREVDCELAASVIGAAAQSFVFSARVLAREHDPAALRRELAHLIDAYLAPGSGGPGSGGPGSGGPGSGGPR